MQRGGDGDVREKLAARELAEVRFCTECHLCLGPLASDTVRFLVEAE